MLELYTFSNLWFIAWECFLGYTDYASVIILNSDGELIEYIYKVDYTIIKIWLTVTKCNEKAYDLYKFQSIVKLY